jgi:transcriptional regulator with XRE-family HTH domain
MKETLGQRLQRLRMAACISQSQLARAASIPVGTLRNLEQDRRVPRLDTADALARALGVGLDALVGDAFHDPNVQPPPVEPSRPRGRPRKTEDAEGKAKGKGRSKT